MCASRLGRELVVGDVIWFSLSLVVSFPTNDSSRQNYFPPQMRLRQVRLGGVPKVRLRR
jgi:hypothetical protein